MLYKSLLVFSKQFSGISRFFKNVETTIVAYHANI